VAFIDLQPAMDAIARLQDSINNMRKELTLPGDPPRSKDLNELFAALAKAQIEMNTASLNSENPYFKTRYSDLCEIVRASRPCLAKNGLSVIQQILTNCDGQSVLHTILGHVSGQYIETQMRIVPPKADVQSLGSYLSYLRRYSYAALVGVTSSNEDDDGEIAVFQDRDKMQKATSVNTKYNPREESYQTVSKDQLEELEYELAEYPDIASEILEKMKLQHLADLPKSKYMVSLQRIREIKQLRNGK
jgi:hypothetical protein